MAPQPRGALADARVALTCLSPVPAGAPFPCAVSILGAGDAPPPLLIEVELPLGLLHVGHDSSGAFRRRRSQGDVPFAGEPRKRRARSGSI